MRADRLISILLLLQSHRSMTAGELAQQLEVSQRTIYRDMEALGIAGIPVMAERGVGGGWSLMEGYRTKLTGLNEAEIQTLFLKPPNLLTDLGLGKASEGALIKLLAALPSIYRRDAEHVRQRIHIDDSGWRRSKENVSFLPTLQEAIWGERELNLTYQRGDDSTVERIVHPFGLVAKGNVWYLVGEVEGDIRSYRVSRVKDATITERSFVRPPDFDLAAFWETSSADFIAALPKYPATVRVDRAILPLIGYMWRYARITHEDKQDEGGWIKLSVQFQTEEEACTYVLGFGPQIEVLEPPELRERVVQLAKSVLEFYDRKS